MNGADSIWNAVDAAISMRGITSSGGPDFVQLEQASSLKIVPIRWLWPGWLARGKLQILAGAPSTGKTTIAMALAATVSSAGRFPCGTPANRGNVLIWSGEDDPSDTLAPRLVASGADLENVFFVRGTVHADEERSFDPGRDIGLLAHEARRIGNVQLLIVDPVVSAIVGDGHKANDVRRGLQPLVDLGQSLDCAVLGITHFSKGSSGRDPLERVMGSQAFGALARVVMVAGKEASSDENSPPRWFVARAKSNIGPDGDGYDYKLLQTELEQHQGVVASYVEWLGAIQGTARELLAAVEFDSPKGEKGDELEQAKLFLMSMLTDGPVPVMRIQAESAGAGFAWRTIERAKSAAGIKTRKLGLRDGWVWVVP